MASADDSQQVTMRWAGALVALGGAMMLFKGVVLIATGSDRSLLPLFGSFTSLGMTVAALSLWRSASRRRWMVAIGGALAFVGVASSLVAVGYLMAGTIPETEGAPNAVRAAYIIMAVGVFGSLLMLGLVIPANRSLPGRWIWLPLGLLVAQFPIFFIAEEAGDIVGSPELTDGLGLALAGAVWTLVGYAVSLGPTQPATHADRTAPARH